MSLSHRDDATTQRATERDALNETARIILDKAIVVHSKLGPGLLESVYRTCLTHELRKDGHKVITEQLVPIVYDGVELDGYRLDMLVNDGVIVEVTTVERLLPVHKAQLLSYLKLLDKRLGLLINFKVPQVMQGVKRVVNNF
ncbi:MAG TPA: GxxExxY protein [Vicinamibacterales bacterium]|nr:GxxExxY protein [Vicinamibacterales bacterium]